MKMYGVSLSGFDATLSTEEGMKKKTAYGRFGPLVVTDAGTGEQRYYTLTHEETGLRCGPVFVDGLLACEAARKAVDVLGKDFFTAAEPGSPNPDKKAALAEICRPFLEQEGENSRPEDDL